MKQSIGICVSCENVAIETDRGFGLLLPYSCGYCHPDPTVRATFWIYDNSAKSLRKLYLAEGYEKLKEVIKMIEVRHDT